MASKSRPGSPELELDAGDLPGAAPGALTGLVVSGVRWKLLSRLVSEATRAVVVVVLARLVTPEEYGLAGMAFVVTSFGLMLTDPALGAALIQRPAIDERDRSTVFWAAAGIGVVLTVVGVALSPLVADFFGEPQVRELFAVSSLCFFVISLSVVHRALLIRRLEYRSLEIREMVAIASGGVVAVLVAAAGYGPWAIVLNFVVSSLVSTALVWWFLDWRPQAMFSRESARNLSGFSGRIFMSTLLTWGDQNVDKALIGRFLGAVSLGAYSLAQAAMLLPMSMLGRPFNQVLSPAFSRIQEDADRLERAWLKSKRLSAAIVLPATLGLIVVAPDFVPVLFGDQWDEAVLPLQLLLVGALATALTNLQWSVLQARGEASTLLRLTLGSSIVKWAAIVVGLQWGIIGVATALAGARWALVVPSMWISTRAVSFGFWPALRSGSEMLPAALATAGIGVGVRYLLLETSTPQAARLALVAAAMLVAYAAILLATAPHVVRELRAAVRKPTRNGQDHRPEGPPKD